MFAFEIRRGRFAGIIPLWCLLLAVIQIHDAIIITASALEQEGQPEKERPVVPSRSNTSINISSTMDEFPVSVNSGETVDDTEEYNIVTTMSPVEKKLLIVQPYLPSPDGGGGDIQCRRPNEIFSNCSNSCDPNCEEPDRKRCGMKFCMKGCECAPGHVRNSQWQCIPKDQCPKCGPNEHFRNCGTGCEPKCSTYQNVPIYCHQDSWGCKAGCYCDYGFVRDMSRNGTCVAIAECPQKCPPNEYWDVMGEPCRRSAENPRPACLFEPPRSGCVCETGFKRDPVTNQCIQMTEFKCGQNETLSYCDSECNRHCFEQGQRRHCPTVCQRGCFCRPEYVRHPYNNRCVLPEDCNAFSSHNSFPVF